MKTNVTTLFAGILALGTLGACSTTNQVSQQSSEVDPLYYTAQDRAASAPKMVKLNDKVTADYSKNEYQYADQSISSKTVNPDLVAEYRNDDNQNEGNDEYYVEDYNRPYSSYGNQPQIVNNYYGNSRRFSSFGSPFYGGGFHDPYNSFYDPFSPFNDPYYNSFAYGSPFYRPGFNMSFGLGFGSPFGWNRWNRFDRFGYGGGFYDPFWGPSLAYGGYGYGGYGGYYGRPNLVIINNGEYTPTTRRMSSGRTASTNSRIDRSTAASSTTQSRSDIRRPRTSSNSRSMITSSQNEAYKSDRRYSTSSGAAAYQRSQSRSNNQYGSSNSRSSQPRVAAPSRSSSRTYQRSNSSGRGSYTPSYGSSNSRTQSYGSSDRGSSFGRSSSPSPSRSYSSGSSSGSTRSYSSGASRSGGGSRRP